ncbi:hydroxyacylglutathione hydrolase [Rhodobacter aestuarii]|uniref:Hydroxyacylglutathione hydrolase n=1 Tax=Rhodobacter aestuarii TaxID=453582 RepID=A0A1N7MNE7_9RHOB|nr:hydroxyacylglutathione hydrolase [Rhodobacter aestuarii]PTV96642.1 hydroxyacylglutathione hydrolase [Rhodobacter aestuarii]SIS87674.1 hydroxyacylglutathione hydrolase [Rhodobacter aestuarii]
MTLELLTIPCLTDNYAYLWHDTATDTVVAVDVPDAVPLMRVLTERDWQLHHILLTHHHDDHIAGAEALAQATGAKIIGAAADAHRLPPLDHAVRPGEVLPLGVEDVQVIGADGHTLGHIAYYLPGAGLLFSGDGLMSWGCGRLFEGSPAQMHDTLTRMAALPPETQICSGHEYTLSNGRFALSLEPDHPALLERMARCEALRKDDLPTLPVLLSEELLTNPFLRGADPALRAALGLPESADPLAVFTEARSRKDRF